MADSSWGMFSESISSLTSDTWSEGFRGRFATNDEHDISQSVSYIYLFIAFSAADAKQPSANDQYDPDGVFK